MQLVDETSPPAKEGLRAETEVSAPWPAQPTHDGYAKYVQRTLRVDLVPMDIEPIASQDRMLGFNWVITDSFRAGQ